MLHFWLIVNSNSITHVHLQSHAQVTPTWAIKSFEGLKDAKSEECYLSKVYFGTKHAVKLLEWHVAV